MKRIVAMIVVILMLGSMAIAEDAQPVDYSVVGTEDLIEIYNAVRDELLSRVGTPMDNFIGRGTYIVGKTIVAGTYDFVCVESGVYSETGYVNNLIMVEDANNDRVFRTTKIDVGGHVTFPLAEGDTLTIAGCSGTITPMAKPIWMP